MRNTEFFYFKREYVKVKHFSKKKKKNEKRKTKSKRFIKKDIHSIWAIKEKQGKNRN